MPDIHPLNLVGLIPKPDWLPPAVARIIDGADILAGTDRLLDLFPNFSGEKLLLGSPLEAWLEKLKLLMAEGRKLTVLTSGDPNYFGLAKKLLTVFAPDQVNIIPSTTVVQQAFARLKVSWERTEVVSLHGRDSLTDFWSALYRASHYPGSGYLAIYTDPDNNPGVIAKRLLGRGQQNWRMWVFEDLDSPDERVSAWTLFDAKLRKFSPLNLVVLECLKAPAPIFPGMPESVFVHEAGLITKREARAAALGLLELRPYHTFWDLGAGSGSISIEAAALLTHGSIWAVEKSPLRSEQITANRAYFGATQVEVIEDDALAAVLHLPQPDRVFVGGGGPDLGLIIQGARSRLKPEGLIVANVLTVEAFRQATTAMTELGLEMSITQLQASRSEPLGESLFLKPQNQIWLIRGSLSKY
ncbi:MAG: precorrin-6y C5,15-methyltransferase (decarboxylating) subunit CbiE [Candidatus Adiutrix sp.]|jgi:precorrin-6Y C5,15-methyltransferase (decarboxylating)|nr:precorrin-6y C5,15-methyltransferase (decarboxylating) subunit CbiE [Candidatus Adiutrix sp.]